MTREEQLQTLRSRREWPVLIVGGGINGVGVLRERIQRHEVCGARGALRASLRGLPGALEAMEAEGIKPEARAETVPVEAFAKAAARLG